MGDVVIVASEATLTRVGNEMLDTAEAMLRDITWFTNGDGTTATTARGFTSAKALDDCEAGWDRTMRVAGERTAVHGDTLIVNAKTYHDAEIANVTEFEDR